MASVPSLQSLTLDLPPSCIAFCPTRPDLFVVGTYFLHPREEETGGTGEENGVDAQAPLAQKRTGSLVIYSLGEDGVSM